MKSQLFVFLSLFLVAQQLAAQCLSGDCRDGQGVYLFPSGSRYVGEFTDGEVNGDGICYYKSGGKYDGQWKNRMPQGKGARTYKDGTQFIGKWRKGQPIDDDGNVIVNKNTDDGTDIQFGCLLGDCSDGLGLYGFPDGSKYEGNFKAGKAEAAGTFFYTNGDRYVGNFKRNFSDGSGVVYHADGKKTKGVWKHGEYIGEVKPDEDPERIEKTGCIRGNCDDGTGVFTYPDGARYIGAFKNGKPHGKGSLTCANRERYKGTFESGAYNGVGTLYKADGTKTDGYWKNGTYMGEAEFGAPESVAIEEKEENTNKGASAAPKPIPAKSKFDPNKPPAAEPLTNANLRPPKVWVMVIGVANYDHMPVLKYTDDDAYRMMAFFKSPEGGAVPDEQLQILIDEEATKQNIKKKMSELFMKAGSNDLAVLYFSGHGLKGSFLPIDYDGSNNKLTHEEVTAILRACPAKYKLCFADACHSGSLLAARGSDVQNMLANYYASLAQALPGTALIMSSKSEETSLESSGLRQGVFSHFLIRGLKGEADTDDDHIISVQELFNFISSKVRSYTGNRQSPVMRGTYDPQMTVSVSGK